MIEIVLNKNNSRQQRNCDNEANYSLQRKYIHILYISGYILPISLRSDLLSKSTDTIFLRENKAKSNMDMLGFCL